MKDKIINRKNIFISLTILWIGLIFSFSLQPADVSSDTSMGFVTNVLKMLFPKFLKNVEQMPQEQLDMLHHIVRKMAHFSEYGILGILSCLGGMELKKPVWMYVLFCVWIASIDETIQLFVRGRAGKVTDVILDSAGATLGIFVVLIIANLWKIKLE